MSGFIRPELARQLIRWREPVIASLAALIGLTLFLRGYSKYNLILELVGGAIFLIGVAVAWASIRRSQFLQSINAPGVVAVDERQVSYMTPFGGGTVDIEQMERLEVREVPEFGRVWILVHSDGPPLFIPIAAAGSEALFDAFSALGGMDSAKLVAAVNGQTLEPNVVWEREPKFRTLT